MATDMDVVDDFNEIGFKAEKTAVEPTPITDLTDYHNVTQIPYPIQMPQQ